MKMSSINMMKTYTKRKVVDFNNPDEYALYTDLNIKILRKRFENLNECEDAFERLKVNIFNGDELITCSFALFFLNVFNTQKYLENPISEYLLEEIINGHFVKYSNFNMKSFDHCSIIDNFINYVICRFVLNFRSMIVESFRKDFKSHRHYANYIITIFFVMLVYKYGINSHSTQLKISMKYFAVKFVEARRNRKISKNEYLIILSKIYNMSKELFYIIKEVEVI